jgi:hypothetical protein
MRAIGIGVENWIKIARPDGQGEYGEVVASFIQLLGARGCSPNTVVGYLHDLKLLFAYLSVANLTIEEFNTTPPSQPPAKAAAPTHQAPLHRACAR